MGILGRRSRNDSLVDFELWGGNGYTGFPIVGESFHMDEIRRTFRAAGGGQGTDTVYTQVELLPNPNNKFDRNAVEVRSAEGVLGFLEKGVAPSYGPILTAIRSMGKRPLTAARIWVGDEYASVSIDLADPHMLVPINAEPTATHVMLPTGAAIQVTGEELHLAELRAFVRPEGEAWVHVTLHEADEVTARTTKQIVQVCIDGQLVGKLSPKMGSDLLPAIQYLHERGYVTGARATVKGNPIKVEVALHCARAHEISTEWLNSVPQNDAAAEVPFVAPESIFEPASATETELSSAAPAPREEPPAGPPAAWYDDPSTPGQYRYWDGVVWTQHTAPK